MRKEHCFNSILSIYNVFVGGGDWVGGGEGVLFEAGCLLSIFTINDSAYLRWEDPQRDLCYFC